ncbi:MAG: UDP-3-O-(3-hydroxymyristoyl)glucosamine N-acyltransferase [Pyrinomonadaceae bacterium]|nr:UDP-3-O-(3-hydroxymyristoyl)glucosamine N-acyltransferase [Pyrinomonadaceae bacterium]
MKTGEIAKYLNGSLEGDDSIEISRVSGINSAGPDSVAFAEDPKAFSEVSRTHAGCVIVPENFESSPSVVLIKVKNPKLAIAQIATVLHPAEDADPGIHSTAVVSESASIGQNVSIGALCFVGDQAMIGDGSIVEAGAFIGKRVKIGQNCRLRSKVVIENDCEIGDRNILHAGVVIGADGFGFVRGGNCYLKFPQIGKVVLENDVEIGANTCIDRGSLGDTIIGEGTKIDNLVQIAHNVKIGKRVVIAAQTGISGSTIIEDDCVIGGQVGMGDHATVKSGAIIGSQAGVLPGKIVREGVWWGTPVQPLDEYKRQNAMVKGLSRLREDVKELKKKLK